MFTPRADVGKSSYALVQPAQAEAQSGDWLAGKLNGDGEPEVIVAPIAAGEQLVASTRSEMHAFIRAHDDRTVAVEIESRGFLAALHANQNVDALRVRGISDLLDAKSVSDDVGLAAAGLAVNTAKTCWSRCVSIPITWSSSSASIRLDSPTSLVGSGGAGLMQRKPRQQDGNESRREAGHAPNQASSGRQTGGAAHTQKNHSQGTQQAASHLTSHTRHGATRLATIPDRPTPRVLPSPDDG